MTVKGAAFVNARERSEQFCSSAFTKDDRRFNNLVALANEMNVANAFSKTFTNGRREVEPFAPEWNGFEPL